MKNSLSPWTLLLCLAPLGVVAHAQPDTNNAPKAENPANRAPRLRPNANMTPEERQKWLLKRQFSLLGADDATQETLAAFIQKELAARQNLAEKALPLQTALREGALSDSQVAALLNTYQVALEDEKTRRTQVLAALNKAIDFKKVPKIEAALTVAGLIGDGPTLVLGGLMGRGLMGRGGGIPGARGQNGPGRGNENRNRNGNRNRPNPAPAQGV